jgi:hypothetical protein
MKKLILIPILVFIFNCTSCTQRAKDSENAGKIENTLISVALFKDSVRVDPSKLLSYFERRNKAIDSIGYPDAGYQLWLIQGDNNKGFRFMSIGSWPNQALYDTIHKNKTFLRNAKFTAEEEQLGLKQASYYRFTIVK